MGPKSVDPPEYTSLSVFQVSSPSLVFVGIIKEEVSTFNICYMNISEKVELNASTADFQNRRCY